MQRLFVPLAADDPLRAEYSRAGSAADEFIKLADENKTDNWMRPAILYLGGLAKYSIGDNVGALPLLERLQKEFPEYKRDQYINNRDTPNPRYAVPVAAGVSKLIFYLRLQVALKDAPNAFSSLQQITDDALTTLAAQREYSLTRTFSEARFGSEPDQRRASALPSTPSLVNEAWDALLEKALQQAGATALRQWLRGLHAPGAPLYKLALSKLQSIDALILKSYFAEAQNLMNQNNFDGARAKYKQIMAEYPNSEFSQRAEEEIENLVPAAVKYYRAEGDRNYRRANRDNLACRKAGRENITKRCLENTPPDRKPITLISNGAGR